MAGFTARRVIFGMRRSNFFTLALLGGLVCYLCFGALIFTYLEHNHEQALRARFREFRATFLSQHARQGGLNDSDLERFLHEALVLQENRIDPRQNASAQPLWTFANSLLFCTTLVTTIGYGSVAALTASGRLFSVAYALCGIPLTLLLMGALVERLLQPCRMLMEHLERQGRTSSLEQRMIILVLVGSLFVSCFLFVPAGVFAYLEPNWSVADSLYYCFISLTTIGLGDLVPKGADSLSFAMHEWYTISIVVYLLSGICFVLLLLAVFYDVPQLNLGGYFLLSSDLDPDAEKGSVEQVTVYMSATEKTRLVATVYGHRVRKATM